MENVNRVFRQWIYALQESLINFLRSGWMVWIVISTMAVCLSVLSSFWLVISDINTIIKSIGSQLQIIVFIKDGVNTDDIVTKVEQINGIANIKVIPKSQAWEEFQREMKSEFDFSNLVGINPLPDTLQITLITPELAPKVVQELKALQGIEEVKYSENLVKRLNEINRSITIIAIFIVSILAVATLAIVINTIRLAVNSRKNEIEIMRLVGAPNWFIRLPFILEGLIFGIISSIISGFILAAWRFFSFNQIQTMLPFLPLKEDYSVVINISLYIIPIGMIIGLLGSLISLQKYLGSEGA